MNQPTAVILTIDDDGRAAEMELVFASRWLAEWFVYQLPYLMMVGQWTQVRAAILSPLVGQVTPMPLSPSSPDEVDAAI